MILDKRILGTLDQELGSVLLYSGVEEGGLEEEVEETLHQMEAVVTRLYRAAARLT